MKVNTFIKIIIPITVTPPVFFEKFFSAPAADVGGIIAGGFTGEFEIFEKW
ncbi:hypothetical protein [Polynucleobacter sp.]|uniref:hypothetical protein n=1 Tax=Polynucleobacter sp. TaxID=2029855 RepID=UPI003F6A4B0C